MENPKKTARLTGSLMRNVRFPPKSDITPLDGGNPICIVGAHVGEAI
jgi:hypothetical protein